MRLSAIQAMDHGEDRLCDSIAYEAQSRITNHEWVGLSAENRGPLAAPGIRRCIFVSAARIHACERDCECRSKEHVYESTIAIRSQASFRDVRDRVLIACSQSGRRGRELGASHNLG